MAARDDPLPCNGAAAAGAVARVSRAKEPGDRLSLGEASRRLGVHYMTAYRYVRLGSLSAEQVRGRWTVRAEDIEEFLAEPASRPGRNGSDWSRLQRQIGPRMLDGDLTASWGLIEQAIARGADPIEIYTKLIGPVLERIGHRWADGVLDVAEEHRATAVTMRIIGRLSSRFVRRGKPAPGTVIVGAAPGDHHLIPVLMVADVLRANGYRVVDLGADVPAKSFLDVAASQAQPLTVAVSLSTDSAAHGARQVIGALCRAYPESLVLAGGPAVCAEPSARALGAHGWAPDASSLAVMLIDRHRRTRPSKP